MGQLADIIANMKTAIATKNTARDGTTALADATAQHNIHPEAGMWVHPGEACFYVHEDPIDGPRAGEIITGGRSWWSRRILVYLGQQTQNTEAIEAGIMSDNIARVEAAVENATGYPSNSRVPLVQDVATETKDALFTARIAFRAEWSEPYT